MAAYMIKNGNFFYIHTETPEDIEFVNEVGKEAMLNIPRSLNKGPFHILHDLKHTEEMLEKLQTRFRRLS